MAAPKRAPACRRSFPTRTRRSSRRARRSCRRPSPRTRASRESAAGSRSARRDPASARPAPARSASWRRGRCPSEAHRGGRSSTSVRRRRSAASAPARDDGQADEQRRSQAVRASGQPSQLRLSRLAAWRCARSGRLARDARTRHRRERLHRPHAVCAASGRGHDVAALVRRAGSAPPGTRALAGDLGDGRGAGAGARRRASAMRRAPRRGDRLAAQRAASCAKSTSTARRACWTHVRRSQAKTAPHAPRFVFASTVVTGDARGALLTEETPLPVHTPYGRSKQEGERLVLSSGLPAVVIRPSHVYGPGGWYAEELIAQLRRPGRFAVIGSGANLWDVVHVDDVAAALVLAIERAEPGSTFHVADDRPISFYDFMALTAQRLGLGSPRRIPARAGAPGGGTQCRRRGRALGAFLKRQDQARAAVEPALCHARRGRRRRRRTTGARRPSPFHGASANARSACSQT